MLQPDGVMPNSPTNILSAGAFALRKYHTHPTC